MKWLVDASLIILFLRDGLKVVDIKKVLRKIGGRSAVFVLIYVVWVQLVKMVLVYREQKGYKAALLYYQDLKRFMVFLTTDILTNRVEVKLDDIFVKMQRIVDWGIRKEWGGLNDYGDLVIAAFALSGGYGILTLDKD